MQTYLRTGHVGGALETFKNPHSHYYWEAVGFLEKCGLSAMAGAFLLWCFQIFSQETLFSFTFHPYIRAWMVLSFYSFLALVCFRALTRFTVKDALILLFLTHFYQIILGWEIEAGPNAVRMLPIILLTVLLVAQALRDHAPLSSPEVILGLAWICGCLIWSAWGPNAEPGIGSFFLWALCLPAWYCFLKGEVSRNRYFSHDVVFASTLGFFLLLVGTLVAMLVGLDYLGSESLLATRSIGDAMTVIGFMLLIWPFVAIAAAQKRIIMTLVTAGFICLAFFSFSRGCILIATPIVVASLLLTSRRPQALMIHLLITGVSLGFLYFLFGNDTDMVRWWALRTNTVGETSLVPVLTDLVGNLSAQLAESGRPSIWGDSYELFLRSPWLGNGIGSIRALDLGFSSAHSTFFDVLAEQGLYGLGLVYGLFALVIVKFRASKMTFIKIRNPKLLTTISFFSWLIFQHTVGSPLLHLYGLEVTALPLMLVVLLLHVEAVMNRQQLAPIYRKATEG
jgi:hypothetical protein